MNAARCEVGKQPFCNACVTPTDIPGDGGVVLGIVLAASRAYGWPLWLCKRHMKQLRRMVSIVCDAASRPDMVNHVGFAAETLARELDT
jgi:hypothetical protein